MINSVNTLEFLKPKLIKMDKFSSTTTTTKLLPPPSPSSYSPTRSFVTFGSHIINHSKTTIDLNKQQQQQQINGEICHQEERVKVQHVENHTKLQNNNCWNNFRTLCNNLSASSGIQNDNDKEHLTKPHHHIVNGDHDVIDVVNMEHSGIVKAETPIKNIQTKSAFNLDLNKIKYHNNSIYINNNNNGLIRTEMNDNNNDQFYIKQYHHNNCDIKRKQQAPDTAKVIVERRVTTAPQRTEDQNNAYRHIESVHNYAKLKYEDDDNDNQSPHGSRHSSYLDDEDDDEEEDDEEDNEEVDKEYDNVDEHLELSNEEYPYVLYADYEDIIKRRQRRRLQKLSTSSDGVLFTKIHNSSSIEACAQKPTQFMQHINEANSKMIKNINEDEEAHIDVDVETVETHSAIIPVAMANSLNVARHIADDSNVAVKPDHHARRPMNAFLIFCKRHRAIVKERYKNLENRAITKILGDWWASLDDNDKKCFTNLAQQNKDAFFSANPNFKWYKLPAPPLRTLTTRPANGFGQDYQEEKDVNVLETISNNTRSISHNSNNNYFKLADEAQMGDLSQLMEDKSKPTKQCADLQQALGETSQFMSAHITAETLEENSLKRRFYNENSFSSNSSEEDNIEPKKKSARSCKGKRYQELINSGQIVTAIKKSKSSTRLTGANDAVANSEMNLKRNFTNLNNNDNNFANNNICQKRSVSELDNILSYDLNSFDLEERIKELPALDLDEYLQRKRNTKKKKKFSSNGKKRGQRNNNNANDVNNKNNRNKSLQATQQMRNASHKNTTTAVGSQKRKARKESITRRDISAIEQEVASLLPLTINGCCYFQEAPTTSKYMQSMEKDTKSTTSLDDNISSEETSSAIIPLQSSASVDILINNTNTNITNNNNNNSNNSNIINDNTSSSTSDLLILAEVAANRTEC